MESQNALTLNKVDDANGTKHAARTEVSFPVQSKVALVTQNMNIYLVHLLKELNDILTKNVTSK